MTLIANNTIVLFNYTLTNDAGEQLDKSEAGAPLAYLHGHKNIIAGLEKALEGKSAGDSLTVNVAPSEGYGEYSELLLQDIPKEMFQGVDSIEVGMQFQAEGEAGQMQVVTVKSVSDDTVTVDSNHPLAGQTLTFDVEIVEVRAATEEELNHGHAHGMGGHQH